METKYEWINNNIIEYAYPKFNNIASVLSVEFIIEGKSELFKNKLINIDSFMHIVSI